MPETRAQRTLVKSPPELWSELSDPASLGRHLNDFGEIRITRVQPETTVEWEGDRASGKVELSASGWGTKVTLTAHVADPPPAQAPAGPPAPERSAPAPPQPAEEQETWGFETPIEDEAPDATAARQRVVRLTANPLEGLAVEWPVREWPEASWSRPPAASPQTERAWTTGTVDEPPEPRRGLLTRLFRRRHERAPSSAEPASGALAPSVGELEVPGPLPTPSPPGPDPSPPSPGPDPSPPSPSPAPLPGPPAPEPTPMPDPAPVPGPQITAVAPGAERATAVLQGILDALGSAHHRPFSR